MLITQIEVTDFSNAFDLRGHVALTTEDGTSYFECHALGHGDKDEATRREMLTKAALDQMQRMPIYRRVELVVQLAEAHAQAADPLAA